MFASACPYTPICTYVYAYVREHVYAHLRLIITNSNICDIHCSLIGGSHTQTEREMAKCSSPILAPLTPPVPPVLLLAPHTPTHVL